eukprot:524010-Prorocentrum_minimum.AAC.7
MPGIDVRVALPEGERGHEWCPVLERKLHKAGALCEEEGLNVVLHGQAFLHPSWDQDAALSLWSGKPVTSGRPSEQG